MVRTMKKTILKGKNCDEEDGEEVDEHKDGKDWKKKMKKVKMESTVKKSMINARMIKDGIL